LKLLIADDDVVSRTMLSLIANKWGFETILAEDGEEALLILQNSVDISLLLLDWKMPRMDGLTVCKTLREQNHDNPPYIIMLTSMSETDDLVKGLDAGANDYIAKPFKNAELRARLKVGERMLALQSELNEVNKVLKRQATHDSLTGLLNHGAILKQLKIDIEHSKREEQPLSIIMCDIDHFKAVNDTYGHLTGDLVLQVIADRIKDSLRTYDHVGRYGGEEFLLLLHTDSASALELTKRIHDKIFNQTIPINDQQSINVSVSCGLTSFIHSQQKSSANELLAIADKALYDAKNNGRNRTCFL